MGSVETNGRESDAASAGLALEDQLCFALYSASRAVVNRYRPLLGELGLTYPQYLVMLVLWEHGVLSVKRVGEALGLDYGTLTPLLKRLEVHGLVRRERSPDDERSVLVDLTDRGAELRERARAVPAAIGTAMGLNARQVADARELLTSLTANVCTPSSGA
jgi:DNA-binding MarR family transcriptional regulator